MSAHQVITGALNRGESVFAVGSVEGLNFTVCAVGCDVVILASNFERVQIIPGSSYGDEETIVGCVDCCLDSGQIGSEQFPFSLQKKQFPFSIAASYGSAIRVFEPTHYIGEKARHRLNYRWFETCRLDAGVPLVSGVFWNLEGLRLLVSANTQLKLYQHRRLTTVVSNTNIDFCQPVVSFKIDDDDDDNDDGGGGGGGGEDESSLAPKSDAIWTPIWATVLSTPAMHIKYSPDGLLFATSGVDDRFVKIWYQNSEGDEQTPVDFSFAYLHHPEGVVGFEWRKTGRYMPRHCIPNVLTTWCKDNISRIWMETPPNDGLVACETLDHSFVDENIRKKFHHKHYRVRNVRHKITRRLKQLKHVNNKKPQQQQQHQHRLGTISPSRVMSSSSLLDPNSSNPIVMHFHLTASINAETDCFLVPSLESRCPSRQDRPFAVHWLNNKEQAFSLGAEKLLADALLSEHRQNVTTFSSTGQKDESSGTNQGIPTFSIQSCEETALTVDTLPANTSISTLQSVELVGKDVVDMKLEALLKHWLVSADILFAVHPIDGSLLIWTMHWLDDLRHQPTISFSSRFPSAFPLTDAASLNPTLSTFNPHDPVYVQLLQRTNDDDIQLLERQKANTLFLLTSHVNGSLNLWHLSMDERSNFATILNIAHKSRMCGHRFGIRQVVCHPVLPLLLTTSQHSDENDRQKTGGSSELILWKVNPVGPLCKSGGIRELARITTDSVGTFTCLAWVPAILPSSTLGSVCNSPSSCFVASNGCQLIIYQAVVDARGLLAELYSGKCTNADDLSSSSLSSIDDQELSPTSLKRPSFWHDTFNVVSTQSTGKPGCILQLAQIDDQLHTDDDVLLLHVFHEQLVLADHSNDCPTIDENHCNSAVVDRRRTPTFSDRYLVVFVRKSGSNSVVTLHMWSLELASQSSAPIGTARSIDVKAAETADSPTSAAQLYMAAEKVCCQELALPPAVSILQVCPSAGHLSSSSLYPACHSPYVLMTACSDDHLRFWRCTKDRQNNRYLWSQWRMISDSIDSALEVDGPILAISTAHSSRLACAYEPAGTVHHVHQQQLPHPHPHPHPTRLALHKLSVEVSVFECESSGGVEWTREDSLVLRDVSIPNRGTDAPRLGDFNFHNVHLSPVDRHFIERHPHSTLLPRISSKSCIVSNMKRVVSDHALRSQVHPAGSLLDPRKLVRIDWVSTENGAHILTVGIGPKVFLYGQVSADLAQRNIVMMKEHYDSTKRPQLQKTSSFASKPVGQLLVRWVCLRTLELHSADGLPPLPTVLTWVREGVLIVGMKSEMRCYNQWNMNTKVVANKTPTTTLKRPGTMTTLHISPSHSMLDSLNKRQKPDRRLKDTAATISSNSNRTLSAPKDVWDLMSTFKDDSLLEAVSDEGLFEAARLSSPMLPQYHPKQLMELLNSGKNRQVKAILLHVIRCIKARHLTMSTGMGRVASRRKCSVFDDDSSRDTTTAKTILSGGGGGGGGGGDDELGYDEIESVPPLPLYALMAADSSGSEVTNKNGGENGQVPYDELFSANVGEKNLDELLEQDNNNNNDDLDDDDYNDRSRSRSRSRTLSSFSGDFLQLDLSVIPTLFTARHNRTLVRYLTHMHLPGLSSVDQMHLLAVADTLSHFSADLMDRLAQANEALVGDGSSSSGGLLTTSGGDSVDECGLRFLMAMKQHEYLLRCLPLKQKQTLRSVGIASSHVIWALHSETENELLNAVPGLHKQLATWDELKALGVGWWVTNAAVLRQVAEKIARSAYQLRQDAMDAALFYLAMRKKNVLTHLFKSAGQQQMADFFAQDFTSAKWMKAAQKNAFVLLGKQRFQHAAAFFLLSGSLSDAVQTCLQNLHDLQLALVIVRLYYETDPDRHSALLTQLLFRNVLGLCSDLSNCDSDENATLSPLASRDPFLRSMAYWLLKDYSKAASTLLDAATKDADSDMSLLSDIFNFYSFLRRHPLVIRQRLAGAGISIGSTEKLLAMAKLMEGQVTPAERRLYFRTAATHLKAGCPLLALEVLSRLPKGLCMTVSGSTTLSALFENGDSPQPVDWSAPTVIKDEGLKLDWSDEDDDKAEVEVEKKLPVDVDNANASPVPLDVLSQHLKFVASLHILMEELATLASGFEVDGGQLRCQLFVWLEKEVAVLKQVCDYNTLSDGCVVGDVDADDCPDDQQMDTGRQVPLHEALKGDRLDLAAKLKAAARRRKWLTANQHLLRCFTSYCALHGSQGIGLAAARMELLLLLLELQQETPSYIRRLNSPLPEMHSFPLLGASVAASKMIVMSPLSYLENQASDVLLAISEMTEVPRLDNALAKVYMLYTLGQCLSSCVYQSLSDVDNLVVPKGQSAGALTRRRRSFVNEQLEVHTLPSRWPGVQNLIALLYREKDEDAPNPLRLLVCCFVAVYVALFSYALTAYDARWLFRLTAHPLDVSMFATIFGGGGEVKLAAAVTAPPRPKPPRPSPPSKCRDQSPFSMNRLATVIDPVSLRAKFNAKVFGSGGHLAAASSISNGVVSAASSSPSKNRVSSTVIEQRVLRWVAPRKSIISFFAAKPPINSREELGVDYDSDEAQSETDECQPTEDDEFKSKEEVQHLDPNSYAWAILRLALVKQLHFRLDQFLSLVGMEPQDLAASSPLMENVVKILSTWQKELVDDIVHVPGGCPSEFLPRSGTTPVPTTAPSLHKYRTIIEPRNTPFEVDDPTALPVRRLWAYLVRQEHLMEVFIRYIFSPKSVEKYEQKCDQTLGVFGSPLPEPCRILQREQDPILAFSVNQAIPGWLVVSTGRELQEMDMSSIMDGQPDWLYDQTELDIALAELKKDALRDNDDYQLLMDGDKRDNSISFLLKRQVGGIRRMDVHPNLSYYVSGANDGSIRLWEWGIGQPMYTPRPTGQFAKVTNVRFSSNGNKFAAVDGDGQLCLWQISHGMPVREPFFSQKCHSKSAADVHFLGSTSSLLATAGYGTGDQNLCLWDTLLPHGKALIQTWSVHPEGASCVVFADQQHTLLSGGRHGELCFWDVRQRQLRLSLKAFDSAIVKTLAVDPAGEFFVAGSSDGDVKIWSLDPCPQLVYSLPNEHAARGGFSLRQVGSSSVHGVQQLFVDSEQRLFSCGADYSLKLRILPSILHSL